jgi:copper(I)-binding protein
MTRTHRFLAAASLIAAAALAHAHGFKLGDITIEHPYARATGPGMSIGGAYLTLANQGKDDRLLSASAPVAADVQLHLMKMEGDVMRMRQVDGIDLPAGKPVVLAPGGLHVMLIGLKAPLKEGDRFPLTLKFEHAGETVVTVNVEGTAANHSGAHDHAAMK